MRSYVNHVVRCVKMSTWTEIQPAISPAILEILKQQNFHAPTPVQCQVLPHFMNNKDVAVQAVTGSGKTLAFVIPIIEILNRRMERWKIGETGAVVILPTRELAVQVSEVMKLFLSSLSLQLLIGGSREVSKDVIAINNEGGVVVVATPGRLADLLERKDCNLAASVRALEVLVLDEADRLLDLGFEATLNTILSYLPKQRRTGLFSATLTHNVEVLIRGGLRNPINIALSSGEKLEQSTPPSLINYYLEISSEEKLAHLVTFLYHHRDKKLLVFFATCAGVAYFSDIVKRLVDVPVLSLHGKMREKRQILFDSFMTMDKGVMMSTDVMARGIDIPDVDWVIQFDPPSSAKAFIHRCGRTARMGRRGCALVFLLPSETAYIPYMDISQSVTLLPLEEKYEIEKNFIEGRVRPLLTQERELYNKSIRAFVSFVRFYNKHECHVIFNAKALKLPDLAYGTYGLLHLPKMPELRGQDTSSFVPSPISIEDIPYKDKSQKRQAEVLKAKKDTAWAAKRQQRMSRQRKRETEERRVARRNKRQKNHQFSASDLQELAHEARLLKRYKAGKISKKELEEQLDSTMDIL